MVEFFCGAPAVFVPGVIVFLERAGLHALHPQLLM
jgi:hypothetical protein